MIGGARANSLRLILGSCGVKLEDVQQIALVSTATMQAMVADQMKFGILHFDEIPVIEQQGKPVKVIARLVDMNPNSHFLVLTARRSDVAKNRDAYVRFVRERSLLVGGRFSIESVPTRGTEVRLMVPLESERE